MSNNELSPQGNQNPLAKITGGDQARKTREAYNAKASSDFYGAVGWMIGFLITLFATGPILFYLARNASLETRGAILAIGFAIAWWFNPLSLGALGYIFSNVRSWRWWTILGLMVWGFVNVLISFSIASETARAQVLRGLLIFFYILLGLLFLYIQLRVFIWAAAGKPVRFFFGILGWAAFNGLVYWAIVNPEILNLILVVLGFVFQIVFALGFAVMQFVAIFWFMSRSRVEIIRPGDPKQITFDDYMGQPNLLYTIPEDGWTIHQWFIACR